MNEVTAHHSGLRSDARSGTGGGLWGAVVAEWTKLWTVRSTWYSLLAAFLLGLFQAASLVASFSNGAVEQVGERLPVELAATVGMQVGQVGLIAMAMLAVTAEYSTGSIRSSLLWVPVRRRLVAAKAAVVAVVGAVAGAILGTLLTVGTWVVLSEDAVMVAGDVVGDVAAASVYAAFVSVFTLGTGLLVRSAAGTLAAVLVLLLVLPNVLMGASQTVLVLLGEHLPGTAASVFLEGANRPYGRG